MKSVRKLIRRIGVFRALQLGDLLCSMPALRALRQYFPSAEIVLIGLPWSSVLQERYPDIIDRVIVFPGYPGLPEQPFDPLVYKRFEAQMQGEHFDLLLQMQGNGTVVNDMLRGWNAWHLAGFHNRESRMDSSLFCPYPTALPEPMRHIALLEFLGIPVEDPRLFFPLKEKDKEEVLRLHLEIAPQGYVCVHPGSRDAMRQWPPSLFARLADYCAQLGYSIFLTGTESEKNLTAEVLAQMSGYGINLAGKTGIGALAWLIAHAQLLIANCTGVSHLAAALETESVIISMDGEPQRWGPVNRRLHKVVDWTVHPDFEEVLNALSGTTVFQCEKI